MAELANLGFKVDTSGLQKGEQALDSYARKGEKAEDSMVKSFTKIKDSIDLFIKRQRDLGRSFNENGQIMNKHGKVLEAETHRFNKLIEAGNKAGNSITKGFESSARGMGEFGKKAGMAGIQFEQLVGSINAGQNPLRALGFQLTDLGFVLGFPLVGAIAGISASMASVLIPALMSSGEAVEDFDSDVKNLIDSLDELSKLTKSQLDLVVLDSAKRLGELSKQSAESEKSIKNLNDRLKEVGTGRGIGASLDNQNKKRTELQKKLIQEQANLDKINQEYEKYDDLIKGAANQLTQIAKDKKTNERLSKSEVEAINKVNDSIKSQIKALRDGEEAAFRFNLAKQFKGGAIPEQTAILVDSLFKIRKEQERLTADKKAVDFFEKQKLALAGLNDELQVLNIRQQGLALGLGNNEIDELVRITEKQQEIKREMQSTKELDDLINRVNDFGGAWTNTGNIIVDSFGNMSNALSDYMKRLDGLGALRDDLAKMEIKHGASDKRVIEARMNLNEKEVQANIAGFKTVAGSFSQMFRENSKEREAFHKLEVALTAVEIALSFQRALAYAKEAIAGASAAPFPLGFAGFAGMAALMAGLGLFGSGGGGVDVEERQKKQGTGTVLGSDDKTESISKNIQLLADVSVDQLFEIKGLKDATISLSDSIEKLAVTLVRDVDFGFSEGSSRALTDGGKLASKSFAPAIPILDPLGIIDFNKIFSAIGGVKKTVEDQGILFLSQTVGDIIDNGFVEAVKFIDIRRKEKALGVTISDKIKRTTDDIDDGLARDMGLVFDSIQMTIEESMTALGFNIDGVLDKFQIKEFELSIKGLSGEEIQKEIESVFGKQADLMAEFIIDLDQFQQVGEGAFETLVRVANEQLRFNNALELMGSSLLGLSMADTQGIIKMFGGLDEFSGATNSFIENFLTSSELMTHQSDAINDVFADLGLTFTSSREGFKNLVTGIDLTTMEGKELFATLTQLSPAIAEYIDKVEAIERERSDLTIDLLAAQGKEEEALAMKRRLELDAMDDSLKALQLQVWAEQDRAKAIAESEASLGGLIDSIRGVVGVAKTADVLGALQSARVGDFTKALELDINKALSFTGASSAAELALQTAITQNRLLEIAKLAEGQLTEGQQQINILSSIDDGISDLNDTFEMPIRNSDDQKQLMAELMATMQDLKYAVQSTAKWSSETALNTRKIYIQSEGV